jgi:hypothetical protein
MKIKDVQTLYYATPEICMEQSTKVMKFTDTFTYFYVYSEPSSHQDSSMEEWFIPLKANLLILLLFNLHVYSELCSHQGSFMEEWFIPLRANIAN